MLHVDFVKMHGLFNSFILISDVSRNFSLTQSQKFACTICSSQKGIGADGLVILRSSKDETSDFTVDFFNADGSQAEMCGNAIRCLTKYVKDADLLSSRKSKGQILFKTMSGIITTQLKKNRKWDAVVSVDMGRPVFDPMNQFPKGLDYRGFPFESISIGNPHMVTFLPPGTKWDFDYGELGMSLQKENFFPKGVNVEFVKVLSERDLEARVIERGVGETLSCGTGACAVVAAYIRNHLKKKQPLSLKVHLLGGVLTINWNGNIQDPMEMIGPVDKVAYGSYIWKEGS